jgi:hypothetical protein
LPASDGGVLFSRETARYYHRFVDAP